MSVFAPRYGRTSSSVSFIQESTIVWGKKSYLNCDVLSIADMPNEHGTVTFRMS